MTGSNACAALGADTSKRGVAAFLSSNSGADYRALQALNWFYNWGDNVRVLSPSRGRLCVTALPKFRNRDRRPEADSGRTHADPNFCFDPSMFTNIIAPPVTFSLSA